MVGDLFHYGHVEQCKRVHNLGYKLVVGVHSDAAVEKYKRKPILSMEERIRVIEACKFVSHVIPNAPLIIDEQYLNTHNIDMVFHGHSLEEEATYAEMYRVPKLLNKFTRTPYTKGISTTNIIERIQRRAEPKPD